MQASILLTETVAQYCKWDGQKQTTWLSTVKTTIISKLH